MQESLTNLLSTIRLVSLSVIGVVGLYFFLPRSVPDMASPEPPIMTANAAEQSGSTVAVNGRKFTLAWSQWTENNTRRIGLSDTGAMAVLGLNLLSTSNPNLQPVSWFTPDSPLPLKAKFMNPHRYLDCTDILQRAGAKIEIRDNLLAIQLPLAQIVNLRSGKQTWGDRLVLDLNAPTFWQVSQAKDEGVVTVEGLALRSLLSQFQPLPTPSPISNGDEDDLGSDNAPRPQAQLFSLESTPTTTKIKIKLPSAYGLQVNSLANPPRLVIDVRPDYFPLREIAWYPGITLRTELINLAEAQFPTHILEIDPQVTPVSLQPMTSGRDTLIGTEPLVKISREQQASIAINGGFFNRQTQLPLGAIRKQGRWLSSPILNRGAIAWTDGNQFKIARLGWQEILTTATGTSYPILFLNSGYLEAGMARYTRDWSDKYTTLTDGEILLTVEDERIIQRVTVAKAGQNTIPIPPNGYLLVVRKQSPLLPEVGTQVSLRVTTNPPDLVNYPHILGAGPVLVQQGKIVLDAEAERFSKAFGQQKASRSAIATTTQGKIILIAVHHRLGGTGPTLTEFSQLVQTLGAVDALNLDGGSSTSLAVGGQLVDRSPVTAARIHNGLGVFLP